MERIIYEVMDGDDRSIGLFVNKEEAEEYAYQYDHNGITNLDPRWKEIAEIIRLGSEMDECEYREYYTSYVVERVVR